MWPHSLEPYLEHAGEWIHSDECDSLLFSCLYAVGSYTPFPVEQGWFEDSTFGSTEKIWHRRPFSCGTCSSTISRDMFMGLFVYCLNFKRLDILDELWKFGWKHFWKMGVETKKLENRVWFTPGLVALLAQLRAHLRGNTTVWRFVPQVYSVAPGFQSHLTMLHLYLNKRMRGYLTEREYKVLDDILLHSPSNPLPYAVGGNHTKALELLEKWPHYRVPTTADWEEEWRTQRADNDEGLLPAYNLPEKAHSGGDLLFVLHVLTADNLR